MAKRKSSAILFILLLAAVAGGYYYFAKIKAKPAIEQSEPIGQKQKTDNNEFCAQVITAAKNPATGEVRDFPTPCDVPEGWVKVEAGSEVSPQSQPESEIPAQNPSESLKTYTNTTFGYELKYPASWGFAEQQKGAFVDFGPGKPRPSEGDLALDFSCLFATGYEGAENVTQTSAPVSFGGNTFTDNKIYAVSGDKKNLVSRMLTIDLPSGYADSHSYNSDASYYKTSCKSASFIVRKAIDDNILKEVFSSFTFVK